MTCGNWRTLPLGGTDVKLTPIGTATPDNLAITRLDGRRDPQTGSYEVFAQVQDLGGQAAWRAAARCPCSKTAN